jgi:hypothetical protein
MTIPYNVSQRSMLKYIKDNLEFDKYIEEDKTSWYKESSTASGEILISHHDISTLATLFRHVVFHENEKINKLIQYLRNVTKLHNILELPVT